MTNEVNPQAIRRARGALCALAMREGADEAQIRKGIQLAMLCAMCSPDPAAQAFWQNVPRAQTCPSPEELIAYIAERILTS